MAIVLFSSCRFVGDKVSDVDFSKTYSVQITFNECVYNSEFSFDGDRLSFAYCDINENKDDIVTQINNSEYTVLYEDMVFTGEFADLPDAFLPKIIYNFFRVNGSVVTFTEYDYDNFSGVYETDISGNFFKFEMFRNSENSLFFSLSIN